MEQKENQATILVSLFYVSFNRIPIQFHLASNSEAPVVFVLMNVYMLCARPTSSGYQAEGSETAEGFMQERCSFELTLECGIQVACARLLRRRSYAKRLTPTDFVRSFLLAKAATFAVRRGSRVLLVIPMYIVSIRLNCFFLNFLQELFTAEVLRVSPRKECG